MLNNRLLKEEAVVVNVLIVDDEVVIREGIIKSIDWSSYEVNIVGEASNGVEALGIFEKLRPDIVITDIRMPVMDGLELSRNLIELMPSVKLVILTGYGEFEYAKKAIELKVSNFILKPVGAEELIKIVLKLRDDINIEKTKASEGKSLELLLQENLPVIRGRFINRLTDGSCSAISRDEIFKKAKTLSMDLSGPLYQVFILAIDDYFFCVDNLAPEKRELIFDSVLNIADEALALYAKGFLCRNEIGLFVGIVNTGHHAFNIVGMCKHLQALILKHLKISISIGIGNEKNDISRAFESFDEAFTALRNRIYKGKNVVIHIKDVSGDNGMTSSGFLQSYNNEEKELLLCLKLIDQNKVNDLLNRLFERFVSMKADYNNIKNVCLKLLLAAFREMDEMGINIEGRLNIQFDLFNEIEKCEIIDNVKIWIINVTGKMIGIIENEKNETYKSIVKIAIDYIMKHYNEPLSLTTIAEKVHVTPNYFSRVFKKETSENFIEWLNTYRIEKAKEFLTDISMKTYEVAEKVGFNDYKQFSYNFRKYVGCSLTEYKNQREIFS